MSTSIYSPPDYAVNTLYNQYDIIYHGGYAYFAAITHTSHPSQTFEQAYDRNLWWGVGIDDTGLTKPEFRWKISYSSVINNKPKVRKIQLGDGYAQRLQDGLNNTLLTLDIKLTERSLSEVTSIEYFLFNRKGAGSFLFSPPAPYAGNKRFVCENWSNSLTFHNNYEISAVFEQVVN